MLQMAYKTICNCNESQIKLLAQVHQTIGLFLGPAGARRQLVQSCSFVFMNGPVPNNWSLHVEASEFLNSINILRGFTGVFAILRWRLLGPMRQLESPVFCCVPGSWSISSGLIEKGSPLPLERGFSLAVLFSVDPFLEFFSFSLYFLQCLALSSSHLLLCAAELAILALSIVRAALPSDLIHHLREVLAVSELRRDNLWRHLRSAHELWKVALFRLIVSFR